MGRTVAHFLDRIEQLSKPQLQALARAMRDEILQLRPDERADAAPADVAGLVYRTRWQVAPPAVAAATHADHADHADRAAAPRVLLLLGWRDAAWPPAGSTAFTCVTARATLDPDTGWAPEALAAQLARLVQASGRFDAIVLALDGEAGNIDGDGAAARAELEAARLAARWGTALALAAAVASEAAPARLWFVTRGAQHLPGDR
ncbi:hypothetical protein XF14_36425, partial [Burkholderia gladioli]